ncbi:MAG: hypothetical protein JXR91_01285 [Deltaproteobacteria bacterium]|nr:hypothetical protein [Deltaproteobacteria bacterium]
MIFCKSFILLILISLTVTSCRQKGFVDDESTDAPVDSSALEENNIAKDAPAVSDKNKSSSVQEQIDNIPELAHGTHFVYGLSLPGGMMPIKSENSRIFKFEGTHSIASVKRYIEKQLAAPIEISKNRFDSGYFIKDALVDARQGLKGEKEYLNIKIFDGSLNGAAVEIWKSLPVAGSDENGPSSLSQADVFYKKSLESKKTPHIPRPRLYSRTEKATSMFSVMDKIAKGEKLSDADFDTPFFTEE